MSIDRDDKFEGHEESEYHFSDEDVSYEVDEESPAPAETKPASEPKESFAARLTRSKRMLISLGVFLVLVFVVYKMVAPTSETPATDIAATAQTGAMPANTPPVSVAAQSQPQVVSPVPQAVAQAPLQAPAEPAQSTVTTTTTTATTAIPGQQPSVVPQQVVQPPVAASQQQVAAVSPVQQTQPEASSLPPVIPVQSAAPTYPSSVAPVAVSDASVNNLVAQSDKLMSDLQAQYTQQYNNFSSQTKALQDQVQALSNRVSSMESQLNQLVQALTQQRQNSSMVNTSPVIQHQTTEVKVGYNVQAIIPGRAWLKSENGETVTVAEGDAIRDVGRVTKIDPYDGVVEINTGSRTISLSYGNGG